MDICFLIGYVCHRAGAQVWAYDHRTYPCDFAVKRMSVLEILRRGRGTVGGLTAPQQAIEFVVPQVEKSFAKMFVFLTDNDVNSRHSAHVNSVMDAARRRLADRCGPIATCVLHTSKLPEDRTMFDPRNDLNGVMGPDAATSGDVIDELALRTETRNFTDA